MRECRLDALGGALGAQHLVASVFEHGGSEAEVPRVVVHHQD